jgi:hypothetical protein
MRPAQDLVPVRAALTRGDLGEEPMAAEIEAPAVALHSLD